MQTLIKDRPIVFFDLETTGTNILSDRIVEISVVKVFPDGRRECKTRRINPEMHIPEESSAVHGIYDKDVENEPTFRQISKNLYIYLEGTDLAGYNITKFDVPVLIAEFKRAGLDFSVAGRHIIDVYHLYCKMEPRNLKTVYKHFCGKNLDDAHSAQADTLATLEVFEKELEKYSVMDPSEYPEGVVFKKDLAVLHELSNPKQPDAVDNAGRFRWRAGEAVIGFGRNAGIPLKKIAIENPDFLHWMLRSDFPEDTKKIASDALKGFFPKKEQ